ncbi:hypothetical protein [[Mycoplasma] mobile]|nr:hypothetical protein [[Mycoplasma] mobile]
MKYQTKPAQDLNLHFDFVITAYSYRELKVEIRKVLREIEKEKNFFDIFIVELIYFLSKNEYSWKWDYGKVELLHLENLKLSSKDLENFKKQMKHVSSFDLVEEK